MKKKEEKLLNKSRKYLDKKYHLFEECTASEEGKVEIVSWKLFIKGPEYPFDSSETILSSENNTVEELFDFAKSHRELDWFKTRRFIRLIILCIMLALALANQFIHNDFIRTFVLISDFYIIWDIFLDFLIWNHNWKIEMRELEESYLRRKRKVTETFNTMHETVKERSNKKGTPEEKRKPGRPVKNTINISYTDKVSIYEETLARYDRQGKQEKYSALSKEYNNFIEQPSIETSLFNKLYKSRQYQKEVYNRKKKKNNK